MRIIAKVKLLGYLRTRFGLNEIEIAIEDEESLMNFLDKLVNLYPEFQTIIKNITEYSGEYLVLINGIDINVYGDISKVKIRNSDEIIFLPIVHGGIQ
ncbi:MAG: MoaD/ThiS family protein [Ignisphaera sp.]